MNFKYCHNIKIFFQLPLKQAGAVGSLSFFLAVHEPSLQPLYQTWLELTLSVAHPVYVKWLGRLVNRSSRTKTTEYRVCRILFLWQNKIVFAISFCSSANFLIANRHTEWLIKIDRQDVEHQTLKSGSPTATFSFKF